MINIHIAFLLFITFNSFSSQTSLLNNIITLEKENTIENSKKQKNSTFIIKDELNKYYNSNKKTLLYVSIANYLKPNIVKFPNTKKDYINNYYNLIGKTERYIQKEKIKSRTIVHNLTSKDKTIFDEQDDIFLRQVIINSSITINIMRNQFITHLENINSKTFSFYDLNILINYNSTVENQSDVLILNGNYTKSTESNVIEDVLRKDNYAIILNNENIKKKLLREQKIQIIFEELTKRKDFSFNLMNYLLFSQVDIINIKLRNIEVEIVPLFYYINKYSEEEFDLRCKKLQIAIRKLIEYLNEFDFSKSDFGIDIFYGILLIIAILIGLYLVFSSIKEFRLAFERKVI